ncbi:MAG: GNAT family N-acetyltransferase [Candidatus Omnitrophica bacterium CG07_land_8_20_14_0_80_42_15]|uniref:GNAT family N-acetyltransferase n=1 Tax=Candidatus Aquitaenariimonas noxiae TaxID=1974741 RepID=A0A2J0KSJ4_9BACT|nr:MAG: GNAT family N-acetyltransferase [Candidatus Omnitrophica bacterium CG07_land_8_20_14_0_80_42_15]
MILKCDKDDFKDICEIINDAASAYKGVIPADCWREPYMPESKLADEIRKGVIFYGYKEDGDLVGVMGIQDVQDVTLIRHAYVKTIKRNKGVGGKLLSFLCVQTGRPILIGTWEDASWAVRFYEKHGFQAVSKSEKDRLLKKYWSIPERQIQTSVVLVDKKWFSINYKKAI